MYEGYIYDGSCKSFVCAFREAPDLFDAFRQARDLFHAQAAFSMPSQAFTRLLASRPLGVGYMCVYIYKTDLVVALETVLGKMGVI